MKEQVLSILKSRLVGTEDDLYRANMQFGNMSTNQLDAEYGQSGRTCKEIFDGYKKARDDVKKCIDWVEQVS